MGALEIERCWFEGFDNAVEVEANNATQMRISQTMIVPDFHRRLLESQPGQWYGWGVKIKFSADNLPPSKGAPSEAEFDPRSLHDGGGGLVRFDS